jgi:hypothetical protein
MTPQCSNRVCCVGIVHIDVCAVDSGEEMATITEPHLPALLHCKLTINLHAHEGSVQKRCRVESFADHIRLAVKHKGVILYGMSVEKQWCTFDHKCYRELCVITVPCSEVIICYLVHSTCWTRTVGAAWVSGV